MHSTDEMNPCELS